MRRLRNLSLKRKLVLLMTLTSGVVLFLASGAFLTYEWFVSRSELLKDLKTQSEIIAANVAGALAFPDPARARQTLQPLEAKPNIIAALIVDKEGQILAQHLRAGEHAVLPEGAAERFEHRFEADQLTVRQPIVFRGNRIGTLSLHSDLQPMFTRLKRYAQIVGIVFLAASLIAFWLASFVQKVASDPIAALSETTRRVSVEKDYSVRVPKQSGDELGVLIDGFNEMLQQIQARDAALQGAQHELERRVVERTEQLALEVAERKQAEAALAAEKKFLAVTLRSIGDGLIGTNVAGVITLFNAVAEELTGWTASEAIGQPLAKVFSLRSSVRAQSGEDLSAEVFRARGHVELPSGAILVGRHGIERIVAGMGTPIQDEDGKIIGLALAFRDVTLQRKLADEVLRSSKLESLGVLAGGIAHDFNNILAAVLGNVSLAKMFVEDNRSVHETLGNAEEACLRARELTGQLLTFSKGGQPVRKAALISDLIIKTSQFVLRGSNVLAEFALAPDLWPVEVDEGQISQVIDNLVINAMQAMPTGGSIRIAAENCALEPPNSIPLPAGNYVHISIRDQGTGIPPEYLTKIFDPYFSTKQKGSGLGLATAYSIIKKHDGHIMAESVLGVGATLHIYLPATSARLIAEPSTAAAIPSGQGRILVMDDEPAIRKLLMDVLGKLGYEGEAAADGEEAIHRYEVAARDGRPFTAVILDLTVPGHMGGKETVTKLREIDPGVRAIVSSGYSNDPLLGHFEEYGFVGMVPKPYRIGQLATTLHEVLKQNGQ